MSLLEQNIRQLEGTGGDFRTILEAIPPARLQIKKATNGSVTAQWQGVYLHSRVNPEKEALRLVESSPPPGAEAAIFYGFGLGYQIEAFFALHPQGRAVVLEPDPELFVAALGLRSYGRIFSREGFQLLLGVPPEDLAAALGDWDLERFRIIRHRPAYGAHPQYFSRVEALLSRIASRREINLNTLKRFGRLWVRNLIQNTWLIREAPGVRHLEGLFSGIPALVLAAGPSLDEVLPQLEELRRHCLLIAVDTSYTACLRSGVEPDLTVVVDPQYWNTRHLDRAPKGDTILVSESSTHPRIFRLLGGRVFLAASVFPLGSYLETATDPKGRLGAGGSVATSAWDLARLLGADPIIMAGLDLGFPRGGTHFKGSYFEERSLIKGHRFLPAETHSAAYLYDAHPHPVPANDGGTTLTDHRMLVYVQWFEAQLRLHGQSRTLSLSSQGVAIPGMDLAGIEDILALGEWRTDIDERIKKIRQIPSPPTTEGRFREALKTLEKELRLLGELCQRGLAAVQRGEADPETLGPEVLSELEGIDRQISALHHRDIAGFLMTSALGELEEAEGKGLDSALRTSQKLYGDLLESVEYHLQILKELD